MIARITLCAAALLSLATQAHALCRDDLQELKPRIDHVKTSNPQRYFLALKWWGKAMEAETGSEVECLNYTAQAKKALTGPEPQIANCTGPNAYLPTCQNGGAGAVQPVMAINNDPLAGLNGGAGGTAVTATAPVTEGGNNNNNNGAGGGGGNPQATGTGRTGN